MENKVQNLNWTGICDPWVHLSALPLSCWVTLGKLFHLPMCKSPTYKKEVMVYISLVLSTCVRNATEKKAHFKLNKWPSPFQFFMLQHLFFLPCTLGQLLKADEAYHQLVSEWFLFSCLWPRSGWSAPRSAPTWLQPTFYLAVPISHHFSLKWPKTVLLNPYLCSPSDTADRLFSEHHLPASWSVVFWSPSLLGSTYQQCQMCWQCGLLVSLSPALAFPSGFSCPESAPPLLTTSGLHGWYPGMSLCLAASSGISLAFDNIHGSTFKILHIPVIF